MTNQYIVVHLTEGGTLRGDIFGGENAATRTLDFVISQVGKQAAIVFSVIAHADGGFHIEATPRNES